MSTYSIIRGQPIREIGAMDLPHPKKEVLYPRYPNRRETLLGLEALRDPWRGKAATAKTISDAVLNPCFPIKYTCTLSTKGGMLIEGYIVTHLELSDWCEMKGYDLVSMDKSPDLALPHERTELG